MGTEQSKNKETKDKQTKEKQTTRDAQLPTVEPVLNVQQHTPLVVSATDGAATKKETEPLQPSDLEQSEVSALWYELGLNVTVFNVRGGSSYSK